jgi:arginase
MGWTLVGAPLNSSAESGGEAHAPAALRAAGVREHLGADDVGDIEGRVGSVERDAESGVLGLQGLMGASRRLRDQVAALLAADARPLVLGGDCTLMLGVGAALQRRVRRPGLWFVDGHYRYLRRSELPDG